MSKKELVIDLPEGTEIETKRFYFPGTYPVTCPQCKAQLTDNFAKNYISYPCVGHFLYRGVYCGNCDGHVQVRLKVTAITLKFELDEDTITFS